MENENKSITEFDVNLISEYFSGLQRQGPGSPEMTLKALDYIDNLTDNSLIADLGCGSGGQTMVMAQKVPGQITGIDIFPTFIDLFNENARKLNLHNRVKGIVGSMDKLPFEEESLDLIWCEGAIYNIGFEKGIYEWHKFLKSGGFIGLTEACWFTRERPKEIDDFWQVVYPDIQLISKRTDQMEKAGYIPVATFILPEYCWIENFYQLQVPLQEAFLKKHAGNKSAIELVASERHEADLYYKYKAFYGYVFFIGKRC